MNTLNSFFDLHRFKFLLIRELKLATKPLIIICSAIIGSYTIGNIISVMTNHYDNNIFNTGNLLISLGFMCIIWASISFQDLIQSSSRQHYLSLPASHFEKLATKWISISILLPIAYILVFVIFGYVDYFLLQLFNTNSIPQPSFEWNHIWKTAIDFVTIQSVFYLGSVVWPRYSIFKTGLALFTLSMVYSLFTFIAAKILFQSTTNKYSFTLDSSMFPSDSSLYEWWPFIYKALFISASILCMIIAYFKLKEKEL